MEPPPPRRRDSPPAIPDELFEEILLRLPPDDPACLHRASLVCKAWSHTVSSLRFRRRLHELHGTPPVLGFFHNWEDDPIPRFISTTASSFSLAAPDCLTLRALDCRHGRALFFPQGSGGLELLLWEPITGAQQRIPVPAAFNCDVFWTAAVLCAADGCDHRDCLGGPFRVVFLFDDLIDEETHDISASVYSSQTGAWGELTSVHSNVDFSLEFTESYSVLVDRSALYFMPDGSASCASVVEYDLASHDLTLFGLPDTYYGHAYNLVLVEDGGIGVIQYLDTRLKLWRREASAEAGWVLNRVMCLANFIPMNAFFHRVQVLGFAEEANVIFFNTVAGLFTIELRSGHVRKVCSDRGFCSLIPVVSFYTSIPRGKHQNLPASRPSGEASGEEGGEEEKTVDQAQQLLNKGSDATKEFDFINTFEYVNHDLDIRVPCYGEGALEGAGTLNKPGCALLPKDSSGDVPKSAPSLCLCFHLGVPGVCECTTRRDDAGNSMTSKSNVDDAPPLEKEQQPEEEERKRQYKEK